MARAPRLHLGGVHRSPRSPTPISRQDRRDSSRSGLASPRPEHPSSGKEKNRNPCIGLAHQHRNRANPRRIGLGRLRSAMHMFRLPAQYVDKSARRHACLCRDQLPLHGPMDGQFHRRLCPDGRRRGELDRRGAVLETGRMCFRTSATGPTIIPAQFRAGPAPARRNKRCPHQHSVRWT
jgi:hypothetical protein